MTTGSYAIVGGDYEGGGMASSSLKTLLKKVGVEAAVVRRAVIAAYEAEMNVVIHAHRGRMSFELQPERLDVEVADEGPGIPDIDRAMQNGFSTAPPAARELGFGAGMGLPNIRKSSDRFSLESAPGRGTVLRFAIHFRPQSALGSGRHSIRVARSFCRECRHCLRACPTQALRVRAGGPTVLDHLCIDCAACIAACPTGALGVEGAAEVTDFVSPSPPRGEGRVRDRGCSGNGDLTLTQPSPWKGEGSAVLLVPQAFLVQFGEGVPPEGVAAALLGLGFARVRVIEEWEAALAEAVATYARSGAGASAGGAPPRPVISPVCPAVVNLVELRYPSLLGHLAPFRSPVEAALEDLRGASVLAAVACPAQRTAAVAAVRGMSEGADDDEGGVGIPRCRPLMESASEDADSSRPARKEVVLPAALRRAMAWPLHTSGTAALGRFRPTHVAPPPCGTGFQPVSHGQDGRATSHPGAGVPHNQMQVTGIRHVVRVLEQVERGALGEVEVLEPFACDQVCFGSPLFSEEAFVARHRWRCRRTVADTDAPPKGVVGSSASGAGDEPATARQRAAPFAARPGLRLDPEMARAIEKLARMDRLARQLPGRDCGLCGAPTCAALAEDIVLGRVAEPGCVHRGTGFQPVEHGQDGRATSGRRETGR